MICPTSRSFLRWLFFGYIVILLEYWANLDKTTFSTKTCTPSNGFQKRYGQNDRRNHQIIPCFRSKTMFAIVKTIQICIFEGDRLFSDSLSNKCIFPWTTSLAECSYIFIMQALGSSGISQFLLHEITRSWHAHQTICLDELVWTEQVSARVMETFVEFSINVFENPIFGTKCD